MCLKGTRFLPQKLCLLVSTHHVSIRSSVQHHWCFSSSTPVVPHRLIACCVSKWFSSFLDRYFLNPAICQTAPRPILLCHSWADANVWHWRRQAASCCQLITFLHADTFTVCLYRRHDINNAAAVPCSGEVSCYVLCILCAHTSTGRHTDRPKQHVRVTPAQTAAHYHSHDAFHHQHSLTIIRGRWCTALCWCCWDCCGIISAAANTQLIFTVWVCNRRSLLATGV